MIFFAYVPDNFKQKKIPEKRNCRKLFRPNFRQHFILGVASKIGPKLNNLFLYGDILVIFLRILSTKSTISQKLKI